MQIAHHPWVHRLDPFLFQVKNIPFEWVKTAWGILGLVLFFGGGFICSQYFVKKKNIRELLQTALLYIFGTFAILFALQSFHVQWGLRWYSLMYLVGFLFLYFFFWHWIKRKQVMLTENLLVTLIAFSLIGMLVGARAAYVFIYNWDYYKLHPLESVATWQGGLSFHGGIVGVCLAIFLFCRRFHKPFFHVTDKIVRVVPLGIAFGRIGNFMNGELWGRVAQKSLPWSMIFPGAGNSPRHPSQLYQSLGEGFGLFLTLWLLSFKKWHQGAMSSFFLVFYGVFRFFVEYYREADSQVSYFFLNHLDWAPLATYPQTNFYQVLTMGQILCLLCIIAGGLMYYFTRNSIHEGSEEWRERTDKYFDSLEKK